MTGFTCSIGATSSLPAELRGLLEVSKICWSGGYRRVQVETDSLLAIQKLSQEVSVLDPNRVLLTAIRDYLHRDWDFSLQHIHREANRCADWLATNHEGLSLELHIFDVPPPSIASLLLADSLGISWPRMM